MARMQQVTNEQGHPKRIDQGVETSVRGDPETMMIMIDLSKSRLASHARMIGRMTTATVDIEAEIETNLAPAGRRTDLDLSSSRNMR